MGSAEPIEPMLAAPLTLVNSCCFLGIAEMFAECGYDLILGFRENISAAEKFKSQLLDKYQSQKVRYIEHQ